MLKRPSYEEARDLLLSLVRPRETERVPLEESAGRVLAQELYAAENVPAFDRSPYDGYALRAADVKDASREAPVTLRVLEEIPAGSAPTQRVTAGTASRVMTGAPIPEGADTVIMFEKTEFTETSVTLFAPVRLGDNVVRAGEDIRAGTLLASAGERIDAALAGSLAAQGVTEPLVYKKPRIAVLSTGTELVEADETPGAGKIRNSNAYTLIAAMRSIGCDTEYLGIVPDGTEGIAAAIAKGLSMCDAVVSTGGVSAGDYDLTPDAIESLGAEVLVRGLAMKPGMASALAVREGKLILSLSGNPASSLTTYYGVVVPVLRKMAGLTDCVPEEITVTLADDFKKRSPVTRFLRGKLRIRSGEAFIELSGDQGNVVLSSTVGCDVMAIVPGGSGPVSAGTKLKGFLL